MKFIILIAITFAQSLACAKSKAALPMRDTSGSFVIRNFRGGRVHYEESANWCRWSKLSRSNCSSLAIDPNYFPGRR
jgi:hypothetical protein